jgi:aminoglycoside/choline kinase family phosphotransferase/CTP:phosphocholine cytidylyltransferase-like protein
MKALILAAGFGTRLLPYTESTPKPLFTIAERPILDTIIWQLQRAGCKEIIINTHHLYDRIESFLTRQKYTIPVITRHEPVILGTAGAIKNVADFWNHNPFVIVNSDIVTDIDIKQVYDFHLNHNHSVTLVLHHDPEFNTVSINQDGFVVDIAAEKNDPLETNSLTFTGIQILDPGIIELIPDGVFSSSIDLYRKLLAENKKIRAFISHQNYWKDIGNQARYKQAVFEHMAPEAFRIAFPNWVKKEITRTQLAGDGSDRKWFRLSTTDQSIVMVDHGIRIGHSTNETDAFVTIGQHLFAKGIQVPEIYLHDTFSGLAFLEDLGDTHLQFLIQDTNDQNEIISHYKAVILLLAELSLSGAKGFDTAWTYQTSRYDKDLILEKECRYFLDAFIGEYLGLDRHFEDFADEFIYLANKALEFSVDGFMHRDLQSRNIMVKNNRYYLIDFQGGRLGPIQYDLASLLIDPYVALPHATRAELLNFSIEKIPAAITVDPDKFLTCYLYCAVTRNLQILGAFGYLSRIRGKSYFETYIPTAIKSLKQNLAAIDTSNLPALTAVVEEL